MNYPKLADFVFSFFIGVISGILISLACFSNFEKNLRDNAVKSSGAFYHPETGEFTWKGKVENVEQIESSSERQ